MRANERTDERVTQYFSLYSWLLSTIVRRLEASPLNAAPEGIDALEISAGERAWGQMAGRRSGQLPNADSNEGAIAGIKKGDALWDKISLM